ncbi:MAG TPA: Gfo/Idh/MocA family oxidoreductase [Mycobacteriales bacterium]|nr:Gfo/Idh/MocA family oxidoreductase [Mycobacteriales bacterium]
MSDRTRVAIIGAGGWGAQHARVFGGRDDVDLCAVVARRQETAAARAEQWGTRGYHSISEMLGAERPDLVTICLPNEAHFAPTLEVIEAGFPLLVEKPLVFDLTEASQLVQSAAERDLFFAINFNHRYAEPVRRAKQAIDNGELGDLVFASWRFGGEGSSTHPHANLIETQCHGLDMLEHLCGPIESVMAQLTDPKPGLYTTLAVALRFTNGAVGSLVGSYDSSYAYPETQRIEVNGTRGLALIEDTVKRLTLARAGDEARTVWEAGYFNDVDREFHRTFDKHVDALLAAFRAGGPPPVDARAGYRALQLADGIIRSFDTGRRIEVAP